jgi:hypothetical protein
LLAFEFADAPERTRRKALLLLLKEQRAKEEWETAALEHVNDYMSNSERVVCLPWRPLRRRLLPRHF